MHHWVGVRLHAESMRALPAQCADSVLRNRSCSALAAMIAQSSLSTLDLSYNPIGEAGTRMLVGALASDTSIHTCVDCAYSL